MARDFGLDFRGGAFAPAERARRHRPDAIENMLRTLQAAGPGAGAAIGGVAGGLIGAGGGAVAIPGVGAVPGWVAGAGAGSAIGGAAGTAIGAGAGFGADQMGAEDANREAERVAREEEKRARAQAALNMLGGL